MMTSNSCKSEKKGVNLHYDEQWERYSEEDVIRRVDNLSPVLDAIISHLIIKPGSRILDLGCGPVIIPLRLCESLADIEDIRTYGIDISNQALQLGKKVIESKGLVDTVHIIKGDCEKLPFHDNIFDNVLSNATINLLLDKKNGFQEIARVTEKEGTVVVGDCTARDGKKCCQEDDDNLWSACIAGAPTKMEFEGLAQEVQFEIENIIELTEEVTSLVKNGHWDWPEFIQYEMDYHVFVMKKL